MSYKSDFSFKVEDNKITVTHKLGFSVEVVKSEDSITVNPNLYDPNDMLLTTESYKSILKRVVRYFASNLPDVADDDDGPYSLWEMNYDFYSEKIYRGFNQAWNQLLGIPEPIFKKRVKHKSAPAKKRTPMTDQEYFDSCDAETQAFLLRK